MKSLQFMLVAGEPSGDLLAAELVEALRTALARREAPAPRFFGAGGPVMAAAGVELELDLTQYALIGISDVLPNLWRLRRIQQRLLDLAVRQRPDVVVCIDYGGFNRRFAAAIRTRQGAGWRPRVIQYVSPQVWASRPSRARTMARDLDLLISILPLERPWYAQRYPEFRVEFVGHPIVDRHPTAGTDASPTPQGPPRVLLLPGSRRSEIRFHWPVMVDAARAIQAEVPARWIAVFTSESLRRQALALDDGRTFGLETQIGGLSPQLAGATLALASTGTVTLECALWRVPTIGMYMGTWLTYQIARRIIQVRHFALPNLLAGEIVIPEFLQQGATPANIAGEAIRLLRDPSERQRIRERLGRVVRELGPPGAADRAATAILGLLPAGPPA